MLRVDLRPSRYLAVSLCGAHFIAGAALLPLDLPPWVKVILCIAVAVSLLRALVRHAFLRSRNAIVAIELRQRDEASVCTRDRQWGEARILRTSYVAPSLAILNVRMTGRIRAEYVVIAPDSCDAEAFRRLRVWLRWAVNPMS